MEQIKKLQKQWQEQVDANLQSMDVIEGLKMRIIDFETELRLGQFKAKVLDEQIRILHEKKITKGNDNVN